MFRQKRIIFLIPSIDSKAFKSRWCCLFHLSSITAGYKNTRITAITVITFQDDQQQCSQQVT